MGSPFLFLDLETTGHNPLKLVGGVLVPWHEIIDMAWILADSADLRYIDGGEVKILPEHPERSLPHLVNDYQARSVRGDWTDAVPLVQGMRVLLDFAKEHVDPACPATLRGQNLFFDWSFLVVACALCDATEEWKNYFHYAKIDNRSMALQELLAPDVPYEPDEYSMRTGRLLAALGLEPEQTVHTAINGARKAYEVACALREVRQGRICKT